MRCSTQGSALSGSIHGHGSVPLASVSRRSATARSAPVQAGQEHAVGFADPVGDHRALLQLEIERGADQVRRDLEQALRQRNQLGDRQAAMSLVHRLGERIGNPGAHPHHGGLLDAELHRDGVGGLEPDAADVARQPIGVLGHDLDGVGAVGLEDAHRPRRADTVAVQEHHDFPHRLLLGPGGQNAGGANRPMPSTSRSRSGVASMTSNTFSPNAPHELLGVDRADAADHAGGEILLDAVGRSRRRGAQEPRLELLAVGAVVDPFARRGNPLAGRNGCGVPNDRHDVPMAPRLGAQDAEAIFGVVIGDALNEARQNFLL